MEGASPRTYPNTSALHDIMTDALIHAGTPLRWFKSMVKSGKEQIAVFEIVERESQ